MTGNFKCFLICLTAVTAFSCCAGRTQTFERHGMEHATLISIRDSSGLRLADIANPWKESVILQSLTLSESNSGLSVPGSLAVPLDRVIVTTNSLAALLSELGVAERIAGVCEPEYISDSLISAMVSDGRIADCGNSMYPDMEKIMQLKPSAIFVSPFEGSGYGQIEKLGIPLIQCADYMETSPLGRAEWMRFYGMLLGVGEKSERLFRQVRQDYDSLARIASAQAGRPLVMLDTRSGSAWYTAGGMSTIGLMIADAGGRYAFADRKVNGSIPLSFETVFDRARDSDIWLLKNSSFSELSYELLKDDYSGYAMFRPFKEKRIWVSDVNSVPYFEQTAFHPEKLLKDFIAIFHPQLGISTTYYHPLR